MSADTMIFDTLQYTKKLTAAGVSQIQAEVQAEAIKELIDDKLVTKNDLKIALRELELRMTIKLGGIVITGITLLVILMKLFHL